MFGRKPKQPPRQEFGDFTTRDGQVLNAAECLEMASEHVEISSGHECGLALALEGALKALRDERLDYA